MRGTNLLLGGAILISLTGAVQAGQSTAREREETRQLNMAQSQSPAQPQAAIAVHDAAANLPANAPPAAAPVMGVQVSDIQMAPMAMNSLSNPPDKIATAKVVDDTGTVVGAVQKVDLDQGGKPTRVEIALLGTSQIVALDSSRLSYDISNNVVTAALDKSQIADLPKG